MVVVLNTSRQDGYNDHNEQQAELDGIQRFGEMAKNHVVLMGEINGKLFVKQPLVCNKALVVTDHRL